MPQRLPSRCPIPVDWGETQRGNPYIPGLQNLRGRFRRRFRVGQSGAEDEDIDRKIREFNCARPPCGGAHGLLRGHHPMIDARQAAQGS